MEDMILKTLNVFMYILLVCAILTAIGAFLGLPLFFVEFNTFFIIVDFVGILIVRALIKFLKEKGVV
jgi:hypothetical protein